MLSFGPSDDAAFVRNPWCFVKPIFDGFNEHMPEVISPGWLITTDESMVAWRGKVGINDPFKIPHRSFIRRKPEPLGCELKNVGDALSGILMQQEIAEGKHRHHLHKFEGASPDEPRMQNTTAVTVRLVERWWGTNRVVAADSWCSRR